MFTNRKLLLALVVSLVCCCYADLNGQNASRSYNFSQNPFKKKLHNPVLVSVGGGLMSYWGDLSDGYDPIFMRPSANVGIYSYFLPQLSVRTGVLTGTIYSNDNVSKYFTHRARNLHFRSRILEFSGVIIYEIFKNKQFASRYGYKIGKTFSPYIFGGAALFHFNPQAEYNGQWVNLQPLGTEGQFISGGSSSEPIETGYPKPYSLWEIAIPFGGGVKFNLKKQISFGFEAGVRKTFTDYLDDVSTLYPDYEELLRTPNGSLAYSLSNRGDRSMIESISIPYAIRGNPEIKDWYFDFSLYIAYHINWKKALGK